MKTKDKIFLLLCASSFLSPTHRYAQAQTSLRGSAKQVTASEYCDFLNCVASSDPDHLFDEKMQAAPEAACILRLGMPGKYFYEVIAGRENFKVTYVSRLDSDRYCAEMKMSPKDDRAIEDDCLKSNQDDFQVMNQTSPQEVTLQDFNANFNAVLNDAQAFFSSPEKDFILGTIALIGTLVGVRCFYPEAFSDIAINSCIRDSENRGFIHRSNLVQTRNVVESSQQIARHANVEADKAYRIRDGHSTMINELRWKDDATKAQKAWETVDDHCNKATTHHAITSSEGIPSEVESFLKDSKREAIFNTYLFAAHVKQAETKAAILDADRIKTEDAARSASEKAHAAAAAYHALLIQSSLFKNDDEDDEKKSIEKHKKAVEGFAQQWESMAVHYKGGGDVSTLSKEDCDVLIQELRRNENFMHEQANKALAEAIASGPENKGRLLIAAKSLFTRTQEMWQGVITKRDEIEKLLPADMFSGRLYKKRVLQHSSDSRISYDINDQLEVIEQELAKLPSDRTPDTSDSDDVVVPP